MEPSDRIESLEKVVLDVFLRMCGEDVSLSSEFRRLELSSLETMSVISSLEDALNVRIPALILLETESLAELVRELRRICADPNAPTPAPPIVALPRIGPSHVD